nr:hypothetical protein [Tanacetum cinerariifolium]
MEPLTFADTYNMVAFLSKSDASVGFDQIVDFLNAHTIKYALVVNPTIYVSCIKQFWVTATIKKVNDVVQLRALIDGKKVVVTEDVIIRDLHLDDVDGVECRKLNFSKYIFDSMVKNVDIPNKFLMYPPFLQVVINNQVNDLTSHNTKYTSPALTHKVFANMRRVGKGFSGVETPLFASILEQPTTIFESSMSLLTTLMETFATLSKKVAELEQDKHTQALEILKIKKRVKKLEKKRRLKPSGFKKLKKVDTSQRVESSNDTVGRIDQEEVYAASKGFSAVEPTVFDDEKVTMTMDQTLIKMKSEKAKLLDEQIAQKLHDKEVQKAAARDAQEKADLERAQVLQKQYDDKEGNIDWNAVAEQIQERHLDNIRKYQNLKKKPVSIAQAGKNMIIYLKNIAGYKMEHFRDVEEPKKKRVAEETLVQKSFKNLKSVEVSGSEEVPSNDPKEMSEEDVQNMLEIVLVSEFKVEALQVKVGGITEAYHSFEDMLKGFDKEDLVALWNLVKEKFSSVVPSVDKEKALWVELKRLFKPNAVDVFWNLQRYMHDPLTWKLYTNCGVHHVSSTRRRDIFMLTEKDYPLSNGVMILMLSAKLQVEEDCEMARDLVMKIFINANKPKSKILDTSSK